MPTVIEGINGEMEIAGWIENGLDQRAIRYAEKFGIMLANNNLSTSQIRHVFGEVRRIQMKGETESFDSELLLLKPKLAYAKARKSGISREASESAEDLQKVLSAGIDSVFTRTKGTKFNRFRNLANFFEAVLAYHKSAGGK